MKYSVVLVMGFVLLFLGTTDVYAQNGKYTFSGRVLNSDSLPIEHATVAVLKYDPPHSPVTVVTTDSLGCYTTGQLHKGEAYHLYITYLLSEPYSVPFTATPDENTVIFSDIHLKNLSMEMEVITVRSSFIKRKADRYEISMQGNPIAIGKSAGSIMGSLPAVSYFDGLKINGRSGTKVFINGREVKDLQELNSIPAEYVENYEVIFLAGSSYDAESTGGVINITLRKVPDGGLFGYVFSNSGFEDRNGFRSENAGSSLSYRYKNLSIFNTVNFQYFELADKYEITTDYADGRQQKNYLRETGISKSWSENLSLVYDINNRHSIGGYFRSSGGSSSPENTLRSLFSNPLGEQYANSNYNSRNNAYSRVYQGALNYVWMLDQRGSNLKIVTDYMRYLTWNRGYYRSDYYSDTQSISELLHDDNKSVYDQLEVDIKSLIKIRNSDLEVGARYYLRRSDNNLRYYINSYAELPTWVIDPHNSDNFLIDRDGYALFAHISGGFGKFMYNAGLRLQYDRLSYNSRKVSEKNQKDYLHLFPSVSFGYTIDETRGTFVNLIYSRSIEEFPFYELNPVIKYESDYFYTKGNPELEPAYSNSVTIVLTLRNQWHVHGGFDFAKGLINNAVFSDENDLLVKYSMPINQDRLFAYTMGVERSFRPFRWWYMKASVEIRSRIVNSAYENFKSDAGNIRFSAFVDNSFALGKGWNGSFMARGETREKWANSYMQPVYYFSAGVSKFLIGERLYVGISAAFRKYRDVKTQGDGFTMFRDAKMPAQFYNITLQYNFKHGRKMNIRQADVLQNVSTDAIRE